MDKYKIEITEPAENDLRSIGLYISRELLQPDTAKRVVTEIGEAILKLEELPLRNGWVSDKRLSIKGIRRIIIDNYIVFYVANEQNRLVTIVRILYNRRDWINLL